jgi:hypothetical protein
MYWSRNVSLTLLYSAGVKDKRQNLAFRMESVSYLFVFIIFYMQIMKFQRILRSLSFPELWYLRVPESLIENSSVRILSFE